MVWENESGLVQENFNHRLNWLIIFFSVCFIVIIAYLFYLQVARGSYFYNISEENRTHLYIERSPRGFIFDSDGNILCKNKSVPCVLFYPFVRTSKIDADKIERLLPGSASKLLSAYKSRNVVCLAEDISRKTMFRLLEQKNRLAGISVVIDSKRYYPYGESACHLLGYVGKIGREELYYLEDQGYRHGDTVGKMGLEKKYDVSLRGKYGGWLMESGADGRNLNIIKRVEPHIGSDIYLTVDMDLQKLAEEELEKTGRNGTIVGLDPRDGAIKILASYPGFDPNVFIESSEIAKKKRKKYLRDKNLPFYNRAIQGEYPPGSAFKIITAIAAVAENKVDIWEKYECPGYFDLGNRRFKCWKEHGRVSFLSGMKDSCNVYFYYVGLQTGIDLMVKYAKKFCLGQFAGVDLPSEKRGFLPDRLSGKKRASLFQGDTANIAIGQGYLDVTALQLAMMISAVANRGVIWQPHVVKKIVDSESGLVVRETRPTVLSKFELPEDLWDILEKGLVQVVNSGTGKEAFIPGLKIAGKTGTAQNPHGEDHALFVAYAPVGEPELVLVVFIEHGGKGGPVAAPVAGTILDFEFGSKVKTLN
jgi:penicillin-binding protein 2